MRVGVAVIDLFTGLYASNAILAALNVRATSTGQGQHIDMALLDVGMAVLANQAAGFLGHRQGAGAMGNTHPSLVALPGLPHAGRQHAAGHWQRRAVRSAFAQRLGNPNGPATSALPPTRCA